jgi:hypothetical protein
VKPSFTQEDIEEAKAICARADQTVNQIQVKATIERCAQVAESYIGYVSAPCPKTLAAAIRALKDEP